MDGNEYITDNYEYFDEEYLNHMYATYYATDMDGNEYITDNYEYFCEDYVNDQYFIYHGTDMEEYNSSNQDSNIKARTISSNKIEIYDNPENRDQIAFDLIKGPEACGSLKDSYSDTIDEIKTDNHLGEKTYPTIYETSNEIPPYNHLEEKIYTNTHNIDDDVDGFDICVSVDDENFLPDDEQFLLNNGHFLTYNDYDRIRLVSKANTSRFDDSFVLFELY